MKSNFTKNFGFGVAEIVIGSVIISSAMFAIIFIAQQSIEISSENVKKIQASFLVEEGLEAARIIRDESWGNYSDISTATSYYLLFDGSSWSTTSTNTFIDGTFERKITVDNIYRDSNFDIADTGTSDPDTKKITVYVSWDNRGSTSTISMSTIVTNINEE